VTAAALIAGACAGLAVLLAGPRPPSLARRRPRRRAGARDRRRAVTPVPAPVLLDLVAEVLAAGAPVPRAMTAVGEALRAQGDPQGAALVALSTRLATTTGATAPESGGRALTALAAALHLAMVTGSGPVALIRAAAQEERGARAARAVRAARRLGVLVLLPTGLCLLPAFVLLTVVPLVLQLVLG
jgi:pilus assembly protein TadC